MKFWMVFLLAVAALASGCDREPKTPREEAERAQEELSESREEAAELIAEAEEDAVDTVADARQEAERELQQAKQKAAEKVEDAERELKDRLDQLSDPRFVEEAPPVRQEEDPVVLQDDGDAQEQPKVRVEIEGAAPEN